MPDPPGTGRRTGLPTAPATGAAAFAPFPASFAPFHAAPGAAFAPATAPRPIAPGAFFASPAADCGARFAAATAERGAFRTARAARAARLAGFGGCALPINRPTDSGRPTSALAAADGAPPAGLD